MMGLRYRGASSKAMGKQTGVLCGAARNAKVSGLQPPHCAIRLRGFSAYAVYCEGLAQPGIPRCVP